MYRLLPPEALDLFQKNYRQIVDIQFNGTANTRTLNESHIIQGGLSIDRYCVSGSRIEIGSAVASELTLKLDNRNDQFADEVFEGAELYVRIGIQKWDALKWENAKTYWIPCGYFTVDETPRKLSNITLAALDRMVRFDVPVDPARLSFPISVKNLLSVCCEICNVPLETDASSLTNAEYMVTALPEEDNLTYRQLIQWIAEISATCAYIDWNGKLRLEWYTNTDVVISPAERYTSDMYEQDVVITGVQVTDDDDNVYLAGTDDYAFNIENNLLIQHDHTAVVQAIFGKVGGFTYRPYNCTCKPMPWLYPLDAITYVDKNGVEHPTIVTRINFKMNASTLLEGKGETSTRNGYAAANPLTKAESVVMKKLENRVNKNIKGATEAALEFNQVISNSLGLFRTEVVEMDNSVSYYYHDGESIKSSTIIYTFRAGGFAWTDDWNNGDPVWNYGVTRDGNAILNYLTVNQLTAEQLNIQNIGESIQTTFEIDFDSVKSSIKAVEEKTGTLESDLADNYYTKTETESAISQTADSILLSVSAVSETVAGLSEDLSANYYTKVQTDSQIKQTADSITLSVGKTIEERAGAIESDLADNYYTKTETESAIKVEADKIALLVESTENGTVINSAAILAAINGDESEVLISADKIDITGAVTIGGLATTDDIPTKTSQLTNNSGYVNSSGAVSAVNTALNNSTSTTRKRVVSIIDGTVTADYIDTLGITVKDASGGILFSARDYSVKIAGFDVSGTSIDNLDSEGYGMYISGSAFGTKSKILTNGYYDENGNIVLSLGETVAKYAIRGVEFNKSMGMLNITSNVISAGYYTYIPLMTFISGYTSWGEYDESLGEPPEGWFVVDGIIYSPNYKYICVRKWNTNDSWSFVITSSLNFSGDGSDDIIPL